MLFTILIKNFKIIFRSPFTLLLLIIGPMLLMLTVGYTFSGETFTDVKIGGVALEEDYFDFRDIDLIKYNSGSFENDLNNCLSDLKDFKLDLCFYFNPEFDDKNNLVSGKIIYYIDNTRPQISELLINVFNRYLDEQTKEISKKTLADILEEIKIVVNRVDEGRDELVYIRENLKEVREEFELLIIEQNLNSEILNSALVNFKTKEDDIVNSAKVIEEEIDYFDKLSKQDPNQIAEPIEKQNNYLFNNFKSVHQLASAIVIIMTLFISLLLSNVVVSLETGSKAYYRNLVSPIPQWKFVLGLFCTNFIIILFQVLFLLFVLNFFFGINVFTNIFLILIVISYLLIIFILLGIILSYLFKSVQVSIIMTTFVSLFMFLLAGIVYPLKLMPSYIYNIVKFNPIVIGEKMIKQIFFFGNINIVYSEIIVIHILITFLIIVLILVVSNQINKRFI